MNDPLVTTAWLADQLDNPQVRIVDMRGIVRRREVEPGVDEADYLGAKDEYLQGHIPGAVYVDWTQDIVVLDDPIPAQLAGPEKFAEEMSQRGIGPNTLVAIYDHQGGQFATRLWWALKYYGHDQTCVVDGGWNRWMAEGRPVSRDIPQPAAAPFTPLVRPAYRATADQVLTALTSPTIQLVDARDTGQYCGNVRRGLQGGHIPGALSLPRETFFQPTSGFKPLDEIRQAISATGLTRN